MFLSAYSGVEVFKQHVLKQGIQHVYEKPITLKNLRYILSLE